MMTSFDQYERCARCPDKGGVSDPRVQKKFCSIYDTLTDQQQGMLCSTSVVGVVDQDTSD